MGIIQTVATIQAINSLKGHSACVHKGDLDEPKRVINIFAMIMLSIPTIVITLIFCYKLFFKG